MALSLPYAMGFTVNHPMYLGLLAVELGYVAHQGKQFLLTERFVEVIHRTKIFDRVILRFRHEAGFDHRKHDLAEVFGAWASLRDQDKQELLAAWGIEIVAQVEGPKRKRRLRVDRVRLGSPVNAWVYKKMKRLGIE